MYRGLYDIEDRAKTLSVEDRLALRQAESVPIMNELHDWLMEKNDDLRVLPKSKLGKSIRQYRDAEKESRRLTTQQRRVRRREAKVA
jgi:hypothetical protein